MDVFHLLQSVLLLSTATAFSIPDPIVHFGIGAIAGGCGAVAFQPFDYVKSTIQSDRGGKLYQNNGWKCLVETLRTEPTDLMKGMSASVTGVAPEKSIKLGVNDVIRDAFLASYGDFPLWSQIVSGAVAGTCQVVVSSPLDVFKLRLQTRRAEGAGGDERPSMSQLLEEVGGVPGLFKGYESCMLRDISFTAVCFPLYTHLLELGMDAFVAGAISGIAGTTVATPFDFIKTRIITDNAYSDVTATTPRLQPVVQMLSNGAAVLVQGGGRNNTMGVFASTESSPLVEPEEEDLLSWNSRPPPNTNRNPFLVAKRIADHEGPGVLLTGVYERVIGAVPRFGITLGAHEWLEHYAHSVGLLS